MSNIVLKKKYKGYKLILKKDTYASNGANAIELIDASDGIPFARASVNIAEPIASDEVAIKDYSENEGILDYLVSEGIISNPVRYGQQGFVNIAICKLLK